MIPEFSDNPLCNAWPFWVLCLTPQCGTVDIERAARDINARLTMKLKGADEFVFPGGMARRDEFLVREARSRLLDPAVRLLCEFWYFSPQPVTESAVKAHSLYPTEDWWVMLEENRCPSSL